MNSELLKAKITAIEKGIVTHLALADERKADAEVAHLEGRESDRVFLLGQYSAQIACAERLSESAAKLKKADEKRPIQLVDPSKVMLKIRHDLLGETSRPLSEMLAPGRSIWGGGFQITVEVKP
jgi:hypothetical protein